MWFNEAFFFNFFFYLLKPKFNSLQFGSICFWNFFSFCYLFIKIRQTHTFFFKPFTSEIADAMSIIAQITSDLVIKKIISQLCLYEENTLQNILCWFLEPFCWAGLLLHFHEKNENIIKIGHSFIHNSIMSGLSTNLE